MKLGLGLYRHMLNRENFQFARQAGATHVVAHLVDYFRGGAGHAATDDQPLGTDVGAINELEADRKSTRLNSSHMSESRMPSSA